MKKKIIKLISIFIILTYGFSSSAHEMWLEPENFILKKNTEVKVNIRVGENLVGDSFPYIGSETKSFKLFLNKKQIKLKYRDGDYPAMKSLLKNNGLYVISYQSTPEQVNYENFSKFESFLKDQNLWDHWSSIYPSFINTEIKERYIRYAKSLVQVGQEKGKDFNTNLEFEIIAIDNPYIKTNDNRIQILILYKNKPHINSQVTIFKKLNNKVVINKIKTNSEGKAFINLKEKGFFLISAIHFIKDPKNPLEWYSMWASLTFYKE